jgi:type IV pilus assembly protein PilY1
LGYNSLTCSGNWDCIQKSSLAFLDSTKNSKQLAFKTAVVGFGSSFNSIPSYDKNKTFAENIKPFVDSSGNKSNLSKQQEAAYWGLLVKVGGIQEITLKML